MKLHPVVETKSPDRIGDSETRLQMATASIPARWSSHVRANTCPGAPVARGTPKYHPTVRCPLSFRQRRHLASGFALLDQEYATGIRHRSGFAGMVARSLMRPAIRLCGAMCSSDQMLKSPCVMQPRVRRLIGGKAAVPGVCSQTTASRTLT